MKWTAKILVFVLCILLMMLPAFAGADFGDFSGDSDYGGSWDSGSDWSSSSWDSDYSSGSYYDDDSDVSGIDIGISLAVMAAIVVLGLIIDVSEKRKKKSSMAQAGHRAHRAGPRARSARLIPVCSPLATLP